MDHGLQIELAQVDESQPIATEKPIIVSIKKRDVPEESALIYLKGQRKDLTILKEDLASMKAANPKMSVIIECDGKEESEILLKVIGAVQDAGIDSVALETEPR